MPRHCHRLQWWWWWNESAADIPPSRGDIITLAIEPHVNLMTEECIRSHRLSESSRHCAPTRNGSESENPWHKSVTVLEKWDKCFPHINHNGLKWPQSPGYSIKGKLKYGQYTVKQYYFSGKIVLLLGNLKKNNCTFRTHFMTWIKIRISLPKFVCFFWFCRPWNEIRKMK